MKLFPTFLLALLTGLMPAMSQDLAAKDLADALSRLRKQRASIAEEKPTIAKSFNDMRASLAEKRRLIRIARMQKSDREALLRELEKKQSQFAQNHAYIHSQLRDYGLKFETFLLPGEEKIYLKALDGIRKKSGSPTEQLQAQLTILEAGLSRLEKLVGGTTLSGEAIAPSGEIKEGTFVLAGPASWFLSSDGKLAGAVVREKGSRSPNILPGQAAEIKTLIAGGNATMKIDVTGGKALALATLENDKFEIFRKGGFWIWPILCIALFATIAGLIKFFQIIQIKTPDSNWVSRILSSVRDGDMEAAQEIIHQYHHPASDLLTQCLSYIKAGPDVVEEVLYEQLIGVQNKLQTWLPLIAITAATAPLLGLLGTVAGMIRTFNVITVSGTGDAKPLAGGISEALVTTLFGLVVAIPALIIHSLLSRRCQGIIQNTEKLGLTFVNGLRSNTSSKNS